MKLNFLPIGLGAVAIFTAGFFAGGLVPRPCSNSHTTDPIHSTPWHGPGFDIDSSGLLRFDDDPEHSFILGDKKRLFHEEINALTMLDLEQGLYVLRLWFAGGTGVCGFDDIGFQVKDHTVRVIFRSTGAIERYLHDNFRPGVKEGDLNAIRISSYIVEAASIVEIHNESEHELHPITKGETLRGLTVAELEAAYKKNAGE